MLSQKFIQGDSVMENKHRKNTELTGRGIELMLQMKRHFKMVLSGHLVNSNYIFRVELLQDSFIGRASV